MMQLTPKERVLMALDHKETDMIPLGMGFGVNPPAKEKLREYLGHDSLAQTNAWLMDFFDLRYATPPYKGPNDRNVWLPDGSYRDIWGIVRRPFSNMLDTYNEIEVYPLAEAKSIADIEAYPWPNPDWMDYDSLPALIEAADDGGNHAIYSGNGIIFEIAWYMRGLEQMMSDVIDEPDFAYALMKRVTDYLLVYFDRILSAAKGKIDIIFTGDDIGGQHGLMVSPAMWESLFKPHHVRLNKLLHERGVKVMYHSDGSVVDAIDGLIDMGIDVLEAFQLDAARMDPAYIKQRWGDRLCFHGGVSVQRLLPFETSERVRDEVAELIRILGKGGGYILAPSHAIQAGTPPENIVAMLRTARPGRFE